MLVFITILVFVIIIETPTLVTADTSCTFIKANCVLSVSQHFLWGFSFIITPRQCKTRKDIGRQSERENDTYFIPKVMWQLRVTTVVIQCIDPRILVFTRQMNLIII